MLVMLSLYEKLGLMTRTESLQLVITQSWCAFNWGSNLMPEPHAVHFSCHKCRLMYVWAQRPWCLQAKQISASSHTLKFLERLLLWVISLLRSTCKSQGEPLDRTPQIAVQWSAIAAGVLVPRQSMQPFEWDNAHQMWGVMTDNLGCCHVILVAL